MTAVATLVTNRATAGSDYAAALAALKAAWIALRQHDIALSDRRVRGLYSGAVDLLGIRNRTFGQPSEWNPACLQHGEFALKPEYMSDWEASATTAALTIITNAS